jgi:hypothetical protein
MWKKGILAFLIVMALGTASGFFYLSEKVAAGRLKIAAGQKQLEDGEKMLAQGKAKLADGQGSLSSAKGVYHDIKSVPLMGIVSKLPVSGTLFSIAHSKIDEGNQLVSKGQGKIAAGEKQLSEGKLDLKNGEKKLKHANDIRITCGIATVIFTILAGVFCCRLKSRRK